MTGLLSPTHQFTTISFEQAIPGFVDPRKENRQQIPAQLVRLATGSRQMLGFVRNVSTGGARIQTPVRIEIGSAVTIDFPWRQQLIGRVIWSTETASGVEFETPLDVRGLLANAESSIVGQFLPRAPRLEIAAPAVVTADALSLATTLYDVSQSGACVEDGASLTGDTRVTLAIEGLPERSGVVRRVIDGRAGIAFNLALPYDLLNRWALARTPHQG